MNCHDLERALEELRPAPISPRLTGRVSAQLGEAAAPTGASRAFRLRLFGQRSALLATVAVLLVGAALFVAHSPPLPPTALAEGMATAPTLLNYQRAFARSSESLDALLDAHAASLGLSTGSSPRAGDGALFSL